MNLIENIKKINGGGIFDCYSEDAFLFDGEVIKEDEYVGLSDRKNNYFYTRHDFKAINLAKPRVKLASCIQYELAMPKVLVLQWDNFDINGMMFAVLNCFDRDYVVKQVEIRKEVILKDETKELKHLDRNILKVYYTEFKPLDNCTELTCDGEAVIPIESNVKVYFNDILRYTEDCGSELKLTLKDQDDNLINATYSGNDIIVNVAGADVKGLMPTQTGQTSIYASNDDGDTHRGRLTDFNTIPYLNPYGNNFRFTDELGGQAFTNGVVIDWSTWNDSEVLGFSFSGNSNVTGAQDWTDWMTNSPYSIGAFNDWYVANIKEFVSVMNYDYSSGFDGYPFNFTTGTQYRLITSTTAPNNTSLTLFKSNTTPYITGVSKSNSYRAILVRIFTITGTTLS